MAPHWLTAGCLTAEVEPYLRSPESIYLQLPNIQGIVVGAMVFQQEVKDKSGNTNPPKTLILRRVSTDTYPLQWELPGGGADVGTDKTIIDTAVRELREETSLQAKRVVCAIRPGVNSGDWRGPPVDESVVELFRDEEGNDWGVMSFLVEIGNDYESVTIDPHEHVDWAWVSEDEIRNKALCESGSSGGKELEFVSDLMHSTILEGFKAMTSIRQS